MSYFETFVAAVPASQKDDYIAHAIAAAAVFKRHGALSVTETWQDDVPEGKVTSFHLAVQREPDERVVVGWVEWSSREARDEGMQAAMGDPELRELELPFDGQRMFFGGFAQIVRE